MATTAPKPATGTGAGTGTGTGTGAPAQQAPVTPVIQELSVEATMTARDFNWSEAEAFLLAKDTPKFLSALSFQEVDYDWVEDILRKVRPMPLS